MNRSPDRTRAVGAPLGHIVPVARHRRLRMRDSAAGAVAAALRTRSDPRRRSDWAAWAAETAARDRSACRDPDCDTWADVPPCFVPSYRAKIDEAVVWLDSRGGRRRHR